MIKRQEYIKLNNMAQCTDVNDNPICTNHPETCTCDYHNR